VSESLQLGLDALGVTAAAHGALIAQLVPVAQELARRQPAGVTIGDVRQEAVRRGLLPATTRGRALAFLGAVMRQAQLVATAEYRRSEIPASHGNLHRCWRLP